MAKMRYYVGLDTTGREVFRSARTPVEGIGVSYNAVIGPFRTRRGAEYMARYGEGNPHLQTVADAERIAAQPSHSPACTKANDRSAREACICA